MRNAVFGSLDHIHAMLTASSAVVHTASLSTPEKRGCYAMRCSILSTGLSSACLCRLHARRGALARGRLPPPSVLLYYYTRCIVYAYSQNVFSALCTQYGVHCTHSPCFFRSVGAERRERPRALSAQGRGHLCRPVARERCERRWGVLRTLTDPQLPWRLEDPWRVLAPLSPPPVHFDWLAGEWGCGPLCRQPWPTFSGRVEKTLFYSTRRV